MFYLEYILKNPKKGGKNVRNRTSLWAQITQNAD